MRSAVTAADLRQDFHSRGCMIRNVRPFDRTKAQRANNSTVRVAGFWLHFRWRTDGPIRIGFNLSSQTSQPGEKRIAGWRSAFYSPAARLRSCEAP